MAKVKMLKSFQGSPDGLHVVGYASGQEYDMPDELASVAVATKHAMFVAETPSRASAPENADAKKAPDIKTSEVPINGVQAKEAEKVEDAQKLGLIGRAFGRHK